jgi:hypothetical protein
MLCLPVSKCEVVVRPMDGTDDLVILETDGSALARALVLLARIARLADGRAADWPALCVTDFEVLLAIARQTVLGPALLCAFDCPRPECGERVEFSFHLAEYVATAQPGRPRGVVPSDRPQWFRLEDGPASFRLPTAADQCAVLDRPEGARLLAERCLDPPDMPAPVRARVERAMAVMAPEVSRPIAGCCPACGAKVRAGVHLPSLIMAELRRAAAGLHEEVHVLASTYHWEEEAILALPRKRRQRYADRARGFLVGAA